MTRHRGRIALLALGVLAVALAAGVAVHLKTGHHQASRRQPPSARSASPAAPVLPAPAGWTLIATVQTGIPRYPRPGGAPDGTVPARWYGMPSALPVIGQQPGWLRVRLSTRPNGSIAWIRRADAAVTATPYRITLSLATRHLELFRADKLVMSAPAGIGTGSDPTPAGQFFAAFFERSPGSGYGPFILVTSAHSETITDWENSGDAVVGIHGPLGARIGPAGAAVSHGCIRLPVGDLIRLRVIPAGTPITITA
jgi:L,D-transpeptidase catalytic domain